MAFIYDEIVIKKMAALRAAIFFITFTVLKYYGVTTFGCAALGLAMSLLFFARS